ncbi:uncharacterized protein LODBEIA_P26190 [Lodderomyces beijingensis]|uniref:Histone acetyltransferase type B catalytic subunit n=1 Tax=Lodderomyces beijingensis TaxID=1775926 RepID=A0ABP0ZJT1_9ASCO
MSLANSKQISAASLQPEVWTSSSNESLKLFITNAEQAVNFKPVFTYPIFGDAETIYGYKNLNIFLCFDHYTFKPFLNIKFSEKLDDPELVDIRATMEKYLPEDTVFKDEVAWVDSINEEKKANYKIPGTRVDSFQRAGIDYEIYKIDLGDTAGLELHKRLQILVLLYIEAGSFIDAKDELWDLYVLYEKPKVEDEEEGEEEPSIVGFTTAYNYWKYPGFEKFDKGEYEVRIKISQFIILPMYQGQGLGQSFYSHLYDYWLTQDHIKEIVVEDPNEGFDDMRDRADLKKVAAQADDEKMVARDIDQEWVDKTRKELKLEKRQFSRLLELILLYKVKHGGDVSKPDVRKFIKRRLYRKNKEGLEGLDEATRKDKLQTAYQALEEDYYRILGDVKLPLKRKSEAGGDDAKKPAKKKLKTQT